MHPLPSAAGRTDAVTRGLPALAVARMDAFGRLNATSARLLARDRARLATITSEKRRGELLAGRRLLLELAAHLALPVAFDGAEGAAGVVVRHHGPGMPPLSASVTHSGDWIACAIGTDGGIGIDLEVLAERDFTALAEASFPDCLGSLAALSGPEQAIAFYRRWTEHEAAIKRGRATTSRCANWVLPGEWVLSLNWSSGAVPPPLLWDGRARRFGLLELEALDRTERGAE
jgi:4'-phosphopantetheinyl transferase